MTWVKVSTEAEGHSTGRKEILDGDTQQLILFNVFEGIDHSIRKTNTHQGKVQKGSRAGAGAVENWKRPRPSKESSGLGSELAVCPGGQEGQ